MHSSLPNRQNIKLGQAIGLRPLDRLQVNSASEIREMSIGGRPNQKHPLPFMYFQRVCADGLLEVSSPGGYLTRIPPEDVCDILHGEPIIVQAMSKRVFTDRLKLSLSERQKAPGPECYAPAYVLRVEKNRWGTLDRVFVDFLDDALNSESQWAAPLHDDDRRHLNEIARRDRMPVITPNRAAGYSADKGIERQERLTAALASTMVKCALRGHRRGVEQLALAGLGKLSHADLNKVIAKCETP